MVQLKGVVYVGAFAFGLSTLFWYAIKLTMGVRVSAEEEFEGLDVGEHGNRAYPDFATHASSFGGTGMPAHAEARAMAMARTPAMAKP